MPSQHELFESITKDTVFDESIYKRIYGYSVTEPEFLSKVAGKLMDLGRKDAIQGYNEWYKQWKAEHDAMMKRVAEWYSEWSDSERRQKQRQQGKAVRSWKKEIQDMSNQELLMLLQSLTKEE